MIMGGASSSSYAGFPDYIGVESCLDMRTDADEGVMAASEEENDSRAWWCRKKEEGRRRGRGSAAVNDHVRKKEYPPLIPLLARTENLHPHMPWVLTRHYTPDGRLVLTEEKVKHHEYFRTHRHNGRLTLHLVTLDDEVSSYGHPGCERKDEYDDVEDVFETEGSPGTSPSAEESSENLGNNVNGDSQEEEEEEEGEGEGVMKGIGCGVGSKRLSYNSVGSPSSPSAAGSCMLGMMPSLPALRQVHS